MTSASTWDPVTDKRIATLHPLIRQSAFDFVNAASGGEAVWECDRPRIAPIAERFGWEWGGHWTGFADKPHVQKTFNRSIDQLVAMPPPQGGHIALA